MNPLKKLHPLVATAAGAVIVLSAVGVAAFTGVLPGSRGATEATQAPAAAPAPTAAAEPHKAKPPHRRVVRHVAARKRAEPAPRHVEVASAKPPCPDCGVIEAVRAVQIKGKGSGVGAAAGGLIGAVAGHEVGGGRGKTLATIVGAVGGAIAGNAIEKKQKTITQWQVTVRLESGREQVVTLAQQPPWREGDHVRLVNGNLEPGPRS